MPAVFSFPRPRSCGVDLDDKDANRILEEHVTALQAKNVVRDLWKYEKTTVKEAASWPAIFRCRHFLADLLSCTRGNVLRQTKWERQVMAFFHKLGVAISRDEATLICRRPRLMLSHLWNSKRDQKPVAQKFQQLRAFITKTQYY